MKKIFVVLIAAFAAVNLMAQNRQKTIHIVDGALVENFDGSQLVGKSIKSYSVDEENNIHYIYTSDYTKGDEIAKIEVRKLISSKDENGEIVVSNIDGAQVKVVNLNSKDGELNDDSIVYVVDGKEVNPSVFKDMDPQNIESMEIISNKSSDNFKKHAKPNTSRVMIIKTRK